MDWFDPAYKAGGPVMSIMKLVENLHDSYEFYILCGSVDYGDSEEMPGLIQDEWVDWKGMAQVYYLSNKNKNRKRIFFILDEVEADIYYVQGVFSLYFSIFPLIWWHQVKKDKIIVATRGMFHASALKVKRLKKLFFLYAAKIMGWYHHVYFHSTNPEETHQLRKILGNEATYVEASNFPRVMSTNPDRKKTKGSLKLLNVARISPEKNTLFLLKMLQSVKGNVTLTLVGNHADEGYMQQCKNVVETLPENISVVFAGHQKIGELQHFYNEHDVFILPTKGENFGHSILEALSAGLPCIISCNTPWNGLQADGAGFNLEENELEYANAIDQYVEMENEEYQRASSSAVSYAKGKVNFDQIKEAYYNLLS